MTARTCIGEPQRVPHEGLSLFAARPAAAYEVHLTHLCQQPCPGSEGLLGGHGLICGFPQGRTEAHSRSRLVVPRPALGSQAGRWGLPDHVPRDLEEYRPQRRINRAP
jgi:hypothetical protein